MTGSELKVTNELKECINKRNGEYGEDLDGREVVVKVNDNYIGDNGEGKANDINRSQEVRPRQTVQRSVENLKTLVSM